MDEDAGADDTVDVSRIISEEDTAERRKGTEKVGLPCHWSLNAINIACSVNAAGHFRCGGIIKRIGLYVVMIEGETMLRE